MSSTSPNRGSLAMQAWHFWRESLLNLAYPAACTACGAEFDGAPHWQRICDDCCGALVVGYENGCPRCAMPLAGSARQALACQECERRQHRFEKAVALGRYEGVLRSLVLRAKAGIDDALALALGQALARRVEGELLGDGSPYDGVLAIPAPLTRQIFRKSNVAEILAEAVASHLRLPRCSGVLRYCRRVKKQANLTPAQRRRNLRGALEATNLYQVDGARLLIIDDVLTTGATADEAARALKKAGAASVDVAVVARGVGYD